MEKENDYKQQLVLAVTSVSEASEDPLSEFGALKSLEKVVSDRLKEIKADAVFQASMVLHEEEPARESGEFAFGGKTFQLSLREEYDFVNNPQRYANEEGADYRKLYNEQQDLKGLVEANTDLMGSILKKFKAKHPGWKPDRVTKVLSWIEQPKRKRA